MLHDKIFLALSVLIALEVPTRAQVSDDKTVYYKHEK